MIILRIQGLETYGFEHYSYLLTQPLTIIYIAVGLRQSLVKLIVVLDILFVDLGVSLQLPLPPDLAFQTNACPPEHNSYEAGKETTNESQYGAILPE